MRIFGEYLILPDQRGCHRLLGRGRFDERLRGVIIRAGRNRNLRLCLGRERLRRGFGTALIRFRGRFLFNPFFLGLGVLLDLSGKRFRPGRYRLLKKILLLDGVGRTVPSFLRIGKTCLRFGTRL
jgi:hypothetical protein